MKLGNHKINILLTLEVGQTMPKDGLYANHTVLKIFKTTGSVQLEKIENGVKTKVRVNERWLLQSLLDSQLGITAKLINRFR